MGTTRLQPNTTQIPNYLLDEVIPNLSHIELRVILVIARQTYGWHKESDRISYSQLVEKSKASRRSVAYALKSLKEKKLINTFAEGQDLSYSICTSAKIAPVTSANNALATSAKIAPTKETNTKEIKTIPLSSSPLEDLKEEILQKISDRYKIPINFVRLQREALINYCESSGKTYRNYEAALRNFCLRDMKNMATRPRRGGVIDATNLQ